MYYTIRGLAGHVLDLYRIARFTFINPHNYTKFRLINSIRKKTNARVFVEAGTYLGITANRCASVFDSVYTIELDVDLARRSSKYLSKRENVTTIQGDALSVIPELLQRDNLSDTLIFLDGHFSGGVTSCGELPEPAVEELRVLSEYKDRIRAIIIDDFRSFGENEEFPSKSELLKAAEESFAEYAISIQLDLVVIVQ